MNRRCCLVGSTTILHVAGVRLDDRLALLDRPVKHVVVLVALANEKVAEKLAKVGVVGLVVKAKGSTVVEVEPELVGEAAAEELGRRRHLLLHDAIVLLLLGGSLEALPREGATEEVHEHVSEGLHVVSTRLLDTQVSVDGCVASCASQVLVLSVRDVQVCLGVAVLFGETKVNDVDLIAALAHAHEEVVWLDVTMDEIARVDVFDARDLRAPAETGKRHNKLLDIYTSRCCRVIFEKPRTYKLVCQEKNRLESEFALAKVEEIF